MDETKSLVLYIVSVIAALLLIILILSPSKLHAAATKGVSSSPPVSGAAFLCVYPHE